MSLTLDEVRTVRFRMTRRGDTGYQVGDVDTFIDKVELTFDEFEKERERLRRELDSVQQTSVQGAFSQGPSPDEAKLREQLQAKDQQLQSREQQLRGKDQEIASLRSEIDRLNSALSQKGEATGAVAAGEQRIRELAADNDRLRSQLDQVRSEYDRARTQQVTQVAANGELITVRASDDAAPAVARLLQMATDQATTLVNEAENEAQRKVAEAEQRANEIKTDARTKAERVESEARVNAEQTTKDAEGRAALVDQQAAQRRRELFADLEREQGELMRKVERLRSFEAEYRGNMTTQLRRMLVDIDASKVEPDGSSEFARSSTPRLDALAGDQR